MKSILGSALVLGVVTLCATGCGNRQPNLDHLGIGTDATSSGTGDAITTRSDGEGWAQEVDSPTGKEQAYAADRDASQGFTIQEGTAGIVLMAAIFDATENADGWLILQGELHVTNPAPDLFDIQLLPRENRRFVVVAKKQGHVDLHVTIDGASGEVTIPIDVIPLANP